MGAVAMLLGARWRKRRRAWLGLALIAGLAGGATTAAAVGARRTTTAYERLTKWARVTDIASGGPSEGFREEDYPSYIAAVERLPQVSESIRSYTPSFTVITGTGRRTGSFELFIAVEPTNRAGRTIDRAKLLAGRRPDPSHADEASLSFALQGPGMRLGDRVQVVLTADGSREQLAPVRIVGIYAGTGDFPSVSSPSFFGLFLTPAFYTRYRSFMPDDSNHLSIAVRLRRGARDVPAFLDEVDRRRIPLEFPTTNAEFAKGVQKSIHFEAVALWLFAALVGVAGVALLAQAIGRESAAEAVEDSVLSSMGMSDRDLMLSAFGRAGVVGAVGAAIAVALAIAASPLTPIGLARTAEPSPGVWIDGVGLAVGAAATVFASLLAASPSALASARRVRRLRDPAPQRPAPLVDLVARAGAPATAVTGVRMAVERASGSAGASGRLWMSAAAGGVAAFAAALVFSASLHHLLDTPRLNGYVWDLWLGGGPDLPGALAADANIKDFSKAAGFDVAVNRRLEFAIALDRHGPMRPLIAAGRAPGRADEIALGRATMRTLKTHIGSTVGVAAAGLEAGAPTTMRVVGEAVIPALIFRAHEPGDGAFFTLDGLERVLGDAVRQQGVYVARVAGGTDLRTIRLPACILPRRTASELSTLSGVSGVPLALAAVLAVIAFATLIQLLVSSVRRRRRDLAVLIGLGFVRRQVRATVLWQTTTMVLCALAVGLPAGAIAGRWGWTVFAGQVAVFPVPRVPLAAVLSLIPATLLIANFTAGFAARGASRTKPALVLRTE
jgi:putative ABC transport system permease protein